MNTSGSDAADTMVRMALSGAEVSVKLTASAAKNALAIAIALARNHKKLYGRTRLRKMLKETRDIRVFQMSESQYRQFRKHAKRHRILYAAVRDKSGDGMVDLILPATELERANMVFEKILYGQESKSAPSQEQTPERQKNHTNDPKNVSRSGPDLTDTRSKAKSGRPEKTSEPTRTIRERPSVAAQLEEFRQIIAGQRASARTPTRVNIQKKRMEHRRNR